MDWTEFVKHGFVKQGFLKHGFETKCIRKSKQD